MSKPRIKYISQTYLLGFPLGGRYVCDSPECTGIGKTKKEAYEDWKQHIAKTAIGRWFQRLLSRLI